MEEEIRQKPVILNEHYEIEFIEDDRLRNRELKAIVILHELLQKESNKSYCRAHMEHYVERSPLDGACALRETSVRLH